MTAECRTFFDQQHSYSSIRDIKCGLNAGNATPDDRDWFTRQISTPRPLVLGADR